MCQHDKKLNLSIFLSNFQRSQFKKMSTGSFRLPKDCSHLADVHKYILVHRWLDTNAKNLKVRSMIPNQRALRSRVNWVQFNLYTLTFYTPEWIRHSERYRKGVKEILLPIPKMFLHGQRPMAVVSNRKTLEIFFPIPPKVIRCRND